MQMGESGAATKNDRDHHGVSIDAPPLYGFKGLDDDGRPQRTGIFNSSFFPVLNNLRAW